MKKILLFLYFSINLSWGGYYDQGCVCNSNKYNNETSYIIYEFYFSSATATPEELANMEDVILEDSCSRYDVARYHAIDRCNQYGNCFFVTDRYIFYRDCILNPICDENQTLNTNSTPPICTDNCIEEPFYFPDLQPSESIGDTWVEPINNSSECSSAGGSTQEQRVMCESSYRCLCTDIPVPTVTYPESIGFSWGENDTSKSKECHDLGGVELQSASQCVSTYYCKCINTPFPLKASNEVIVQTWNGVNEANNAFCTTNEGRVQSQSHNCKTQYRCVKETDNCEVIKNIPISSYVSPSDNTFHEDITITGANFGLHYSSAYLDDNQSKTIAYGWSLSNHATLTGDRLYLGSGSLQIVEPIVENGLTVVKSGSLELIFDTNAKHIQTRDLYTKEAEITFVYDNKDNLIGITNRYEETTIINRDDNSIVTSIVAPHGQTTYLSINENGDLLEVQYEDSTSYTFEYEKHLMTLEREPNGNEFLHLFDKEGRVVKVIDAEQGEWEFDTTSDTSSNTYTVTDASGDITAYKKHFLENGILRTQKTLPTGDIILYENSVDDSRSSSTACGQTNTNLYKQQNGLLVKDPLHNRRILESSTQTTPSGLSKTSNYSTNYSFDTNNKLLTIEKTIETNGATTASLRDYNLSTLTQTSAEGIVSKNSYNPTTQNLLISQYADLEPINYRYDDKGRAVETTQGNRTTTYTYNERGNLASITDPKRKTTTYSYDLLERVIETTYPDRHRTKYLYDANGNMTTLTTPTPTDHTFTYSGVNRRTNYTSPLQSTTTYTYDKQRRVTKVTKPSQKSINYSYTDGRLTTIQTPEATTNYNYSCQNNLANITKSNESFNFTYDGSLLTSMVQSGVLNQTISYTYNNDFIPSSMTYAGETTNFTYDNDGLLIYIGALGNAPYALTRNSNNSLVKKLTDGIYTQKRRYNKYGELYKVDNSLYEYDLKRDKTKIKSKRETVVTYIPKKNGKGTKKTKKTTKYNYTYDSRDRLIKVKKDKKVVESYTYDVNGNRASATVDNITTTASYTLDDQLVVYGDNAYRYNDDGYLMEKMTPQGTTTYSYGTLGELRVVQTPTQTITYLHNANNKRVAKLVDNQIVEKYLWLNLTTLLAVYDKDDNLIQRYEYADQRMPIAMTTADNTKYYLHYDQVGSLRAISRVLSLDNTLEIVKEITYDTFGNILTDSNPSFKVPFGFAGGLYDQDTKLTRFGYRDYDAYTGKWTAKDPIGFGGGDSNLYGYVLGDPVGGIDPEGLWDLGIGGGRVKVHPKCHLSIISVRFASTGQTIYYGTTPWSIDIDFVLHNGIWYKLKYHTVDFDESCNMNDDYYSEATEDEVNICNDILNNLPEI